MTELTSFPRCPDDDKMEALFEAREEEMQRLRMELDEESMLGKGDLIQILKWEMVELMEQDVALWQQLKELEGGITSLRHDMIATRNRSNTFSSITEPDPKIYEGEGHNEIFTKPRSHTVTSSEEFCNHNTDNQSVSDAEHLTVRKPLGIKTEMKPIGDTLGATKGIYGIFGMFNAFDFKSGLFQSGMNRLRNNVFLTGLNPNLTAFVEDLIKPSVTNQILPRRKLHRQCRVLELDEIESTLVRDDTNNNEIISISGNEDELIHCSASDLRNDQSNKENNVLELLQTNENEDKDVEKISRDITHNNNNHLPTTENETVLIRPSYSDSELKGQLHKNRDVDNTSHCQMGESSDESQTSSQNEITLADRSETLTGTNRDTVNQPDDTEDVFSDVVQPNGLIDDIIDSEDSDSDFTYLTIKDGFVTCRIMTPGLEQQIRLKHETEGEPLDYLKYESGFVRFISDSESCSSRDSYQSDDEYSSEWGESDDDTYIDIFEDIKRLFDADGQEEVSSIADAHLVKERNGSMPSISYSDTNGILEYQPLSFQELSTDTHGKLEVDRDNVDELNEEVDEEFPPYSGTECLKTIDETNCIASKEFTREADYGTCVYRERVCSFTFKISNRISSVDSGIGEDMSDSFDNTD